MLVCAAGVLVSINPATALTCPTRVGLDDVPSPPSDFCSPIAITAEADFYEFSWQLFKYLVWPAEPGSRGVPDKARKIHDMDGPRVFETYKADWEVFRSNAEDPGDWNTWLSSTCSNRQDIKPGALVLAPTSKFSNLSVGRRSDHALVLIAQNGTYVRYQVSYNDRLFDSIKRNKLYDSREFASLPVMLPRIHPRATADDGAIVLKSAWIELPEGATAPADSRYYVQDNAWVQDPGRSECRRTSVGLVGLHIVAKTENRPQWIWSSFEHVDNVPEEGDRQGKRYTFNDGSNTPMTEPDSRDPNNRYLVSNQVAGQVPPPYQVERLQKIAMDAATVNASWQAKLKAEHDSVWQNYKLVTSQWLKPRLAPDEDVTNHPIEPACGDKTPASANTTMETFQQVCTKPTTCLGCHNGARTTDHIFSIRLHAQAPAQADVRSSRDEIVKQVEDILNQVKTLPRR